MPNESSRENTSIKPNLNMPRKGHLPSGDPVSEKSRTNLPAQPCPAFLPATGRAPIFIIYSFPHVLCAGHRYGTPSFCFSLLVCSGREFRKIFAAPGSPLANRRFSCGSSLANSYTGRFPAYRCIHFCIGNHNKS